MIDYIPPYTGEHLTKHDKIARIIGLAEQLNVKIDTKKKGGKHDRTRTHKALLPDKP